MQSFFRRETCRRFVAYAAWTQFLTTQMKSRDLFFRPELDRVLMEVLATDDEIKNH